MGSVFGKESVAEPHFDVVLQRENVKTPYEMRKYGERFAATVTYASEGDRSPFGTLARYIGVFGTPQNEGSTSISMTAPVVMEQDAKEPESIAMTAPVVMETEGKMQKMMFMLPAEYDDMSKIPKPTDSSVHIEAIPPEIGVAHRFSGRYNPESSREVAKKMGDQLILDGVEGITEEIVLDNFQYFGYNPPFTLGPFRRNEVWLKLNEDQVNCLKEKYPTKSEGGLVGGSTMKGRTMFTVGLCGLAFGAYAFGMLMRSRSQYRRL